MDTRDKPWFPVIHFPSRFAPYKNSTSQFWSAAHIDGKLCKPDPNTFWARNIGLSVEDAKVINIALGRRMSIEDLWRYGALLTSIESLTNDTSQFEIQGQGNGLQNIL